MKLFVTPNPADKDFSKRCGIDTLRKFKAIVNVSDSPCLSFDLQGDVPSFWFPVHEVWHWGYAPFFGAAKVVDHYGGPVLIHCHAGVNRSMCVGLALCLADDIPLEEIKLRPFNEGSEAMQSCMRLFEHNVKKGYIPSDIIPFLKARKAYPTYSMMGLLQTINSPNLFLNRLKIESEDKKKEKTYSMKGNGEWIGDEGSKLEKVLMDKEDKEAMVSDASLTI